MEVTTEDLTLTALRAAYSSGKFTPTSLCTALLEKIEASDAVFITKPAAAKIIQRCAELEKLPPFARGPLWGVPFAVKDNIDVAGFPTTCACPGFSYIPDRHALIVAEIIKAGGVCLGKTNMDQFAAGLVGTRSPYGTPANSFDHRFSPGGSSSGSAVAVAEGMVTFALGTDTAGSGRVPAGLNGIVGIKPSVGRWSTIGVVPACATLDCPSVFVLSVEDGIVVRAILDNSTDVGDPTWRPARVELVAKTLGWREKFKFAVPGAEFWGFGGGPGGDKMKMAMELAMADAIARLETIGGERVTSFDFTPFAETAVLLYGGAFIAERYSGIRSFLEAAVPDIQSPELADISNDERILKVTRLIIANTKKWNAADVFKGLQSLGHLRAAARLQLAKIDILVVPTTAYVYTVAEIGTEEEDVDPNILNDIRMLSRNANLGRFTNFVNLLEMCGVSVPSSVMKIEAAGEGTERAPHLEATGKPSIEMPFGITMLAPAWTDGYVAEVAAAYEHATGLKGGPLGHGVTPFKKS